MRTIAIIVRPVVGLAATAVTTKRLTAIPTAFYSNYSGTLRYRSGEKYTKIIHK
jgi:hypothetical protein